jgi:hypothetical protein
MYKLDTENGVVIRSNNDGTNTFIPINEENSDYQEYLASLEANEQETE